MPRVCSVRFRGTRKCYYFAPGETTDLKEQDRVIVETARGREMGEVVHPSLDIPEDAVVGQLKPVLRRATTADLLDAQRYRRQEQEALQRCREEVARLNLPMKVVHAEYSYDGLRLTFSFTSEQRVDFRDLVRELAHIFKTRIELRQIGVRDEAKIIGGVGKCGQPLCCATWLDEFYPVSIRMAKQQDLPLSPMEISGVCGRLLCCLGYENDFYQEVKSRFPKVGKNIETPLGVGKVVKVCVLTETVQVLFEDGSTASFTADQLAGREPLPGQEVSSDMAEGEMLPEEAPEDVWADAGAERKERTPGVASALSAPAVAAGERRGARQERPQSQTRAPSAPPQTAAIGQARSEGASAEGAGEPGASRSSRRRGKRSRGGRHGQGDTPPKPPATAGAEGHPEQTPRPHRSGKRRPRRPAERKPPAQ